MSSSSPPFLATAVTLFLCGVAQCVPSNDAAVALQQPDHRASADGVRVELAQQLPLFDAPPKRFLLVANNERANRQAGCVPTQLRQGDVVVRFNHMQNRSDWFGGRADLVLIRATGPDSVSQAAIAKKKVQGSGPRVLAVIGEHVREKELRMRRLMRSLKPHTDGVMLLPDSNGHAPYSTGFAAVEFVHRSYPDAAVLLLGFDSHAEQPQHPGTVALPDNRVASQRRWTMWHDFSSEREMLMAMPNVEHCAAAPVQPGPS